MRSRILLTRLGRVSGVVLVLAAMTLLVLWLSGVFATKTEPTEEPARVGSTLPAGVPTVAVEAIEAPVVEEAVGTIRAVQEVEVASRILGRIRTMHVRAAGQQVAAGGLLVELEDDELQARLGEARAAERSARETRDQAQRDLARTEELFQQQIASEQQRDRDRTAFENAVAAVERAAQSVAAAETMLGYATIRSPIDGVVIDKLSEQGDTVGPGQKLMRLYDPTRMQLVASVREHLATRLEVGGRVEVAVDALGLRCHGEVSEIVPLAEPGSRAFDVKVVGPCPDGVFTGMFGRLLVDLGTRRELRVPAAAVRSIGQIDQVVAVGADGRLLRRFVVLGARRGDDVVVQSGLRAGERIVADTEALRAAESAAGEAGR